MKLSTRGRYGVRAMLELAMRHESGPVKVAEVARRQGIAPGYLEQLMARLVTQGLVRPVRGRAGGFVLAKVAAEVTIAEIVQALEGSFAVVQCVDDPSVCERASACATRDLWQEVSQSIQGYLSAVTLDDLLMRQREKETAQANSYDI